MPVIYERRSFLPAWAWIAIVLGLVLVVMLVWFVAAGTRPDSTAQYGVQPTPVPAPTPTPETSAYPPPPAAQQEAPATSAVPEVRVYVEERKPSPDVVIVQEGEKPPGGQSYQLVDVPGQFNMLGRAWKAEQGSVIAADSVDLVNTGSMAEGHVVYAAADDVKPYDALFIETSRGSGKYIEFSRID